MNADDQRISFLVEHLQLQPHPEGGFFKEMYRSHDSISSNCLPDEFDGSRNYATSIYFLLSSASFSAFHRIRQDETWHFYEGGTIELHVISTEGKHNQIDIGASPEQGTSFQYTVPKDHWFAAKVKSGTGYALVGCTVAPGFDFKDFELAKRNQLIAEFPQHESIIKEFTR